MEKMKEIQDFILSLETKPKYINKYNTKVEPKWNGVRIEIQGDEILMDTTDTLVYWADSKLPFAVGSNVYDILFIADILKHQDELLEIAGFHVCPNKAL